MHWMIGEDSAPNRLTKSIPFKIRLPKQQWQVSVNFHHTCIHKYREWESVGVHVKLYTGKMEFLSFAPSISGDNDKFKCLNIDSLEIEPRYLLIFLSYLYSCHRIVFVSFQLHLSQLSHNVMSRLL